MSLALRKCKEQSLIGRWPFCQPLEKAEGKNGSKVILAEAE